MAAIQASSRPNLLLLTVFALGGIAVLVGLGFWQLQRLSWKETLIERITMRLQQAPVGFEEALKQRSAGEDIDFLRVKLRGTYDHAKGQYFYALNKGEFGWRVLTPLKPDSGQSILIDRGFLPDPQKPVAAPASGSPVELVGALRLGYLPKEMFTPDNDASSNSWYWFDVVALRKVTAIPELAPMVIQLDTPDHSGQWPVATALSPNLPNKHFGYALTWFGLAITLLGVYIAFIVQERRKRSSP
ncbi:MAG: SURF1 family protein [Alphaproteobacteria bacterium]|nr:SURF1 family protein [Alphaproteobacteria bacterium]